jgi:hypothetical protein
MNLDLFGRYKGNVDEWAEEWMGTLSGLGMEVVDVEDMVQEDAHFVFMEPAQFQRFCIATGQRAVFHMRGEVVVDEQIRSVLEKLCEDGEDPTLMAKSFETHQSLLVKRARQHCPNHFYAEFSVLHQGAFISCGVLCEAYDLMMDALAAFCESADERREEAKQARLDRDAETLERLADELLVDPEFAKIRGRRKRCVYVLERYGTRVPKSPHGELRRIDAHHDPFDFNLAALVERVSDRLELSKQ